MISALLALTLAVCVSAGPLIKIRDLEQLEVRQTQPCGSHARGDPACGTFPWANIGDSWASGVAYLPTNTFDNNKDNCLRITESYTAQMQADKQWTTGKQDLRFAACSGSKLVDMASPPEKWGGHYLVSKTGSPRILTMTVGGNNAGFFNVARACIFQHEPNHDYGAPFPDPKGECGKAIQDAYDYILNPDKFKKDLTLTYNDIFLFYKGQGENFDLYHTGYVSQAISLAFKQY